MTPEQFLAKCEAAFAANEPQVIPESVARAMMAIVMEVVSIETNCRSDDGSGWRAHVSAFTAACKEIEA